VGSTRVALSWSPSSGSVAGYTVYRNGSAIATTGPEDILSSAAGPQAGSLTLGSATNWYMVLSTFRPLATVGPVGPVAAALPLVP